jgi:putative sigma-54 modulation protein
MKLDIQARPFELTAALEAHIRRKLRSAFSRVAPPLTGVSVALSDINGPRGGEDKQCKLQFSLPGMGLVVIKDRKSDLYHAIDSAAHRARYAIARSMARRQKNNRGRGRPALFNAVPPDDQLAGAAQ